jgi:biopolymer transport protein TolQ
MAPEASARGDASSRACGNIPNLSRNQTMSESAPLSIAVLFGNADIVVKGVLLLLLGGWALSWAVILDKVVRLRMGRRSARAWARGPADAYTAEQLVHENLSAEAKQPAGAVLVAEVEERGASDIGREWIAERRERIDRAMRLVLGTQLRQLELRLPFLAKPVCAAPFIGLFGTVAPIRSACGPTCTRGIMGTFNAIAAAQSASLSVVAPGIADALFATATGFASAIPAVAAYKKFTVEIGRSSGSMQEPMGRSSGLLNRTAEGD